MTRGKAWRAARETATRSLRDVDRAICNELGEYNRAAWASPSKLSRFENDEENVVISPLALGVMARLYGCDLRDLDPKAAEDLDRLKNLTLVLTGAGKSPGKKILLLQSTQKSRAA